MNDETLALGRIASSLERIAARLDAAADADAALRAEHAQAAERPIGERLEQTAAALRARLALRLGDCPYAYPLSTARMTHAIVSHA
jgi:hypothetical protein